ncbi:hypothetical protein HRJ35_14185 [Shewanella oneidensis MR-1]|uniref:hypothetical protein n=1 Tax=Shewanella oneidensis TaxID=70863 RepID=UPI00000E1EC5|nr:hypothetical protein [Shewanella oneidensis]MDX5995803.1 hypothetical protein [Shewanella oneidensis]QKG97039.1 hypothetical protein HRJ35_14185 [Shewanella oneidensis MR-1]
MPIPFYTSNQNIEDANSISEKQLCSKIGTVSLDKGADMAYSHAIKPAIGMPNKPIQRKISRI